MEGIRLADAEEAIGSRLVDLVTEGGDGNFLIVSVGDAYVQFAGERGNSTIRCEAVSNHHLPAGRRLDDQREQVLAAVGFVLPMDGGNYECVFEITDDGALRRVARATVEILRDVYRCRPDREVRLDLRLERFAHPDNPALLAALATPDARAEALDFALLNAVFLVPVAGDQIRLVYGPDDAPAVPVFSDFDAFQRTAPHDLAYERMSGAQLFPYVRTKGCDTVVVNPAGPYATVLPPHRVAELAAAVALR